MVAPIAFRSDTQELTALSRLSGLPSEWGQHLGGPAKDYNGNWVAVCNNDYDGPLIRAICSIDYPEVQCADCGTFWSDEWYTIGGPMFPPVPDRDVCERCARCYG